MTDWDKEYSNREHVGSDVAEAIIAQWQVDAGKFRDECAVSGRCQIDVSYGIGDRNRYDLFTVDGAAKGTVIFVHGGYWQMLDKSFFSHLAQGPLANGWNVAMPSYTLTPEVRIGDITRETATAITEIASALPGPLRLTGHSAGGHLVARMHCADNLLEENIHSRIEKTVAISGVFDLAPLLNTMMNENLQLDDAQVMAESPAHLDPRLNASLTCIVGGGELPEFLRQNTLLLGWQEQGADVEVAESPGKHHFNVIEPLVEAQSDLTSLLLS